MKFLSSTTLGLASFASLAAAAPLVEAEPGVSPAPAPLQKRFDSWHYCNDDKWKGFGERAFLAGLRLMGRVDDDRFDEDARDQIPDQYLGEPGWCTNLWCGGEGSTSVVFYLCVKPETEQKLYGSKDLAQKFHDGFHDCFGKREPRDEKDEAVAFHVWDDGYSLHVEGRSEGTKCPEHMQKKAFPFPDSLNHAPYVEE
ncbi:hypothetical protein CC78DRAFT_542168 [Lojkania enalia]|uniref:Uncharacterized protein n=1 Tax=Lojkania enalia TaxID=147567 RepID=A0A9P4KEW0_9PLEO|nr:hypothetical protein CC78DRAFT_542168 [Didymosphaeria enalia]